VLLRSCEGPVTAEAFGKLIKRKKRTAQLRLKALVSEELAVRHVPEDTRQPFTYEAAKPSPQSERQG
jgi:predicted transcriptional regulator